MLDNQIVTTKLKTELPMNVVLATELMSSESPQYRKEVKAVCHKYHSDQLYFDLNNYDLMPMTYGQIKAEQQKEATGQNQIVVTDEMLPAWF